MPLKVGQKEINWKKSESKKLSEIAPGGVVIFEGGRGIVPDSAELTKDMEPLWRWTICLERSDDTQSFSVDIDAPKAGYNYPWSWEKVDEDGNVISPEIVSTITINYQYNVELSKFGGKSFQGKKGTKEELIFQNEKMNNPNGHYAIKSYLSRSFGGNNYKHLGKHYYYRKSYQPYTADNHKNAEECEFNGSNNYLLYGRDIPLN